MVGKGKGDVAERRKKSKKERENKGKETINGKKTMLSKRRGGKGDEIFGKEDKEEKRL